MGSTSWEMRFRTLGEIPECFPERLSVRIQEGITEVVLRGTS